MLKWFFHKLLRRGLESQRQIMRFTQLERLTRSGIGAWAAAQEKARLEFISAKEAYECQPTWSGFKNTMERLLQLQSTNAVIQALINEQLLEQLYARTSVEPAASSEAEARRVA